MQAEAKRAHAARVTDKLVGQSPVMRRLRLQAARLACCEGKLSLIYLSRR